MTEQWQTHDFFQLMSDLRQSIQRDYQLVKKRSKEDPGTAGDQVEEQWAEILRNWLPAIFPVVTKGRILFEDGSASPQIDVLVLKPSYPLGLRRQKHFFAGGVLAAFECKLTLRAADVSRAFKTCAEIKRKMRAESGTPFDELYRLPIFGVLAHTQDIGKRSTESAFYRCIQNNQTNGVERCFELIDVFCVADEATVPCGKHLLMGSDLDDHEKAELTELEANALIWTMYTIHSEDGGGPWSVGAVLAGLIYSLTVRLAMYDCSVRDWADHLSFIGGYGGIGQPLYWTADELSAPVLERLMANGRDEDRWSKWSKHLP